MLVGKAVVILDDVDAVSRKKSAEAGQFGYRQALRFEGRAGKRPVGRRADKGAQALDAESMPAEGLHKSIGKIHVGKFDHVVHG